ncbi:hypothetical protein CLV28_0532 [Sediminihabitans luteus]|uniref:Uncharacterized protein n=1 Tax=Sediminihabitans luteus TaxID=1138585 RepID=A0A2M9CZN7_9CELL|nr:hypothetical protein [Sediminihabitans luteus]PJJ77313.1 hypothetical protein CLV28_0532 [Sediminihabitans luteus]GII98764.1 hypothetical protein Slu03_11420 [Sediminihabitans luteus]
MSEIALEYCGEWFYPNDEGTIDVGRDGDLAIDDNPYLHRQFLRVLQDSGIWWLVNRGSRISATVSDAVGGVQSWLAPGTRLPVVFPTTTVVFTAGPTTYELGLRLTGAPYQEIRSDDPVGGATTIGAVGFSTGQKQVIVALAEAILRRDGTGLSEIPSTADAAARLGLPVTTFNRKLDTVCDKLDRIGVKGLRGGPRSLATNRRARLVEYAVASRLVTADDLHLLDDKDGSSCA